MAEDLTDDTRMMFGKHRGERLIDIPDKYWDWYKSQPELQFSHPGLWRWLNKPKTEPYEDLIP